VFCPIILLILELIISSKNIYVISKHIFCCKILIGVKNYEKIISIYSRLSIIGDYI
jgi:hypothetical protein